MSRGAVRNHGPLVFLKVHGQKAAGGTGQLAERPKQGAGIRPDHPAETFAAIDTQTEHEAKGKDVKQNPQGFRINRHRGNLHMKQILSAIWDTLTAAFTDWLPTYQNVTLGGLEVLGAILGILAIAIAIKKHLR